jgi:hypothetical protein
MNDIEKFTQFSCLDADAVSGCIFPSATFAVLNFSPCNVVINTVHTHRHVN